HHRGRARGAAPARTGPHPRAPHRAVAVSTVTTQAVTGFGGGLWSLRAGLQLSQAVKYLIEGCRLGLREPQSSGGVGLDERRPHLLDGGATCCREPHGVGAAAAALASELDKPSRDHPLDDACHALRGREGVAREFCARELVVGGELHENAELHGAEA